MTQHLCDEVDEDNAGFLCGRCTCGWQSPPCPDSETAVDFLMQHARERALIEDVDVIR